MKDQRNSWSVMRIGGCGPGSSGKQRNVKEVELPGRSTYEQTTLPYLF